MVEVSGRYSSAALFVSAHLKYALPKCPVKADPCAAKSLHARENPAHPTRKRLSFALVVLDDPGDNTARFGVDRF